MENNEVKARFVELRAKGNSFDKISMELRISKPTLIKWSKELQFEIQNMKALELDVLLENYALSRVRRIEFLAHTIQTIKKSLDSQDLGSISLEKQHLLLLKYLEVIKKEAGDVLFKEEEDKLLIPDEKVLKEWEG